MSSLTPEQVAEVRAIVAEMLGQTLRGVNERILNASMAAIMALTTSTNRSAPR
ncbi:hypothetical protein [Sphingomonas hankookensis]|nr:hypothetical protein [Sphingomonas hankookensis]